MYDELLASAKSTVITYHVKILMTSILFDAQSNNWSDNKSFYEVSNSLFICEFFHLFALCFCRAQKIFFFLVASQIPSFLFYTLSSSFPIYQPILSLYLSLLHSSPSSLPFIPCLSPSFRSCVLSSFLGNFSISATFLIALLPRYFVFLSPVFLSHSSKYTNLQMMMRLDVLDVKEDYSL